MLEDWYWLFTYYVGFVLGFGVCLLRCRQKHHAELAGEEGSS